MECIDRVTVALLIVGFGSFLLLLLTAMELIVGFVIRIWRSLRRSSETRRNRLESGLTLNDYIAATAAVQSYDLNRLNVELSTAQHTDPTSDANSEDIGRAA
jgi:hypothetical protein